MTDLTTLFSPTSQTATGPAPTPVRTVGETTLITEQQVMFSTAAAVQLPATTRRWTDAIGSVTGAVRAFFADLREPAQRHHPKRYDYLENSLMGREMERL